MVRTAIKSILETASIPAKVYGLHVPHSRGANWIIVTNISNVPNNTKKAVSTLDKTRWQLDCYSNTEERMDTLGAAVRAAMDNYSGTVESVIFSRITFDGESDTVELIEDEGGREEYYRRTQEYLIHISR